MNFEVTTKMQHDFPKRLFRLLSRALRARRLMKLPMIWLLGAALFVPGTSAQAAPCVSGVAYTTVGVNDCLVPAGVISMDIAVTGGGGGGAAEVSTNAGGKGAQVSVSNYAVTPGGTLTMVVGGGGGMGGTPGGGGGGGASSQVNAASAIYRIIAGGGGGGAARAPGDGTGGNGGTPNGANGIGGSDTQCLSSGGCGGSGGNGGAALQYSTAGGSGNGGVGGGGSAGDVGGSGGAAGVGDNLALGRGGAGGHSPGASGGGGGGGGFGGGGGGSNGGGGGGGSTGPTGAAYGLANNAGAAGANGGNGSITLTFSTATGRLNDTGQTQCFNSSYNYTACNNASTGRASGRPGQDGRYGRDVAVLSKTGGGAAGFDFSKMCFNGQLQGAHSSCTGAMVANTTASAVASTTDWACTKDNVTNLVWSLQVGSGDWATYARSSLPAEHNAASRCGFSTGWRLPGRRELISILNLGATGISVPKIDSAYFPGTPAYYHWTIDSYLPVANSAWFVHFDWGHPGYTSSTDPGNNSFRVRLVHDGL